MPGLAGPTNIDVLADSPVRGQAIGPISPTTVPDGGGVLASGSVACIFQLSNTTAFPWNTVPKALPGITDVLLGAMENVYGVLGNGSGNWTSVYRSSSGPAPVAQGTQSA